MSEEAPLRDRSHIEKTLMLNEDKPADDYSGNQRGRRWPGAGAGKPWGGGSEASGHPRKKSLEVGGGGGVGLRGRDSASSVQGLGALDWQAIWIGKAIPAAGSAKGSRTNPSAVSEDGASFHTVAGEGR